jgi:hypothetical protein
MILYHGTNVEFDVIDLTKSKPNKDFGRGFYLSDNYEQALNMAKTKVEQFEVGLPIVMKYEVDDNVFQTFRVLQFKEYTKEWAQFILQNRNNSAQQQVHDYDIVIGPIANDRVGVQLWRYNSHSIDLDTLVKNLRYMHGITIQYFFGTERAIQQLKRI